MDTERHDSTFAADHWERGFPERSVLAWGIVQGMVKDMVCFPALTTA